MISIKEWSVIWTSLFGFINNWLTTAVIVHIWPDIRIENYNWLNAFLLSNTELQVLIAFFTFFSIIIVVFRWQWALNARSAYLVKERIWIRTVIKEFTWFWNRANIVFSLIRIWVFMRLVCWKTLSTFFIEFERLITFTLSPIIIIVSWSQTFNTLLSIPEIIFWTIFRYISALVISFLNYKEFIALITCPCNKIVFFLASYTWFQIFSRERLIGWALLNWEALRLKFSKLVVNWFTIAILCDPIFAWIIVRFFVKLLAFMSTREIFLLIFTVSTWLCSNVEKLAGRTKSASFTIWRERLISWTLLGWY